MQNRVKKAIVKLSQCIGKFGKSQAGNVGMLFGLSAIPIFLAAGSAIDYSRVANSKANLIAGLDSSALYAAALSDKTEAEMKVLAKVYLDRNYANTAEAEVTAFDLKNYADRVEVTGTVRVKTWFMSVGGITSLDIPVMSEVKKAGNSVEVALVLDNTASMATGTKMADLKAAAIDFVDTVVWEETVPYYSKVAVIPYSNGVNVGALANAARGTPIAGTSTTPGSVNFTFKNPSNTNVTHAISTCVSERTGANKYTDAAVATNPVGRHYPPSGNPCIASQLRPLTNNTANLNATINSMVAGGSTAGQVGIAWGWYTLSPNFGLWTGESVPAAYPAPGERLHKIMVLMTDAEYNSGYCNGVITGVPTVSGSGAAADHINCAASNSDSYTQSTAMCTAIKNAGIEVYTIEFELDTSVPQRVALMNSCATDSAHRITASNSSQLQAAFNKIAQNLLELRVSK
jgi:Flp pilus assembly protein TadG